MSRYPRDERTEEQKEEHNRQEGRKIVFLLLITLAIIIFVITQCNEAEAAEPEEQPWGNLYLNIFETGTIILPENGSDPIPLSTSTSIEINPIFNISKSLMWSAVFGIGTPNTVCNPFVYANTGPVVPLAKYLLFNPFVMYEYIPAYVANGNIDMHLFGIGTVFAIPINYSLSFLIPASWTIDLDKNQSFTTGFAISLTLPGT